MDDKKLTEFLQKEFQESNVPGAQVFVQDSCGETFSFVYGFADAEKSKPINEETIFGIASMSKSLTCTAISILEHEGKVSWKDPVRKFFPQFSLPGIPPEAILLEHLAMHTTGVPPLPILSWSIAQHTEPDPWEMKEYQELKQEATSAMGSIDEIIEYLAEGNYKLLGQPGEYRSYLNEGYALLSSVVDIVAQQPLEEFLRERVFIPLGMKHTTFDLEEAKSISSITDLFSKVDGDIKVSQIWDEAPPYRGCGWVKSTASDMVRYYRCLALHGKEGSQQILPTTVADRMFGPRFETTEEGTYCFGLNKRLLHQSIVCDHSGGLKGVASRGGFMEGTGFAVTILTNLGSYNTTPAYNALFNAKWNLPLETEHVFCMPTQSQFFTPDFYTGRFSIREGKNVEIEIVFTEQDGLHFVTEGLKYRLTHCGGSDFLMIPDGGKSKDAIVLKAYIRNGKTWAYRRGSRMLQRVE